MLGCTVEPILRHSYCRSCYPPQAVPCFVPHSHHLTSNSNSHTTLYFVNLPVVTFLRRTSSQFAHVRCVPCSWGHLPGRLASQTRVSQLACAQSTQTFHISPGSAAVGYASQHSSFERGPSPASHKKLVASQVFNYQFILPTKPISPSEFVTMFGTFGRSNPPSDRESQALKAFLVSAERSEEEVKSFIDANFANDIIERFIPSIFHEKAIDAYEVSRLSPLALQLPSY